MKISVDHVTFPKNSNAEAHEHAGIFTIPNNDMFFSSPGYFCNLCLSVEGIKFLELSKNPFDGIFNVTVLEEDPPKVPEGDNLNTVQDLINYLSTLDPKKYISGEYVKIILDAHIGNESRPLLKSLIKDEGDHYTFGPMIY